jgi:hypothetical protein
LFKTGREGGIFKSLFRIAFSLSAWRLAKFLEKSISFYKEGFLVGFFSRGSSFIVDLS